MMKRGQPLTRTPFRRKPKAKAKPVIAKATGRRIDGGKLAHWISPKHLELVRAQACLISRYMGPEVEAHHARELVDRGMGRRRSDFIAVPLRKCWHDPNYPGSLHHSGGGTDWWDDQMVDPLAWLRGFLMRHYKPGQNQGADEALAMVNRRIAMSEGAP